MIDIGRVEIRSRCVHADNGTVTNVPLVGGPEIGRHRSRARRNENLHRCLTSKKPSGQPQSRRADRVIEMQVREQHMIDPGEKRERANLHQALAQSPARIDEEALIARFDENARSVALKRRARCACPEKGKEQVLRENGARTGADEHTNENEAPSQHVGNST